MLNWERIERPFSSPYYSSHNVIRYFPSIPLEHGKSREIEGSLYFDLRFFICEKKSKKMDLYPFTLIVCGSLHYDIATVEDGMRISEVIFEGVLKAYKEKYDGL